jgi:hypothetical protein
MNDGNRLIVLILAVLCLGAQPEQEIEDVREAAFRHLFKTWGWGYQRPEVFCIEVEGKDPSDALVHRFDSLETPVKKGSECSISPEEGVRDRKTGKRGLWFDIGKARPRAEAELEVDGGYSTGLGSAAITLRLRKKEGKWSVVDDVIRWVS